MSIVDKLKLDKYNHLAVINEPADYDIISDKQTSLTGDHDAIFIFITRIDEMIKYTQLVIKDKLLVEKGYLFFAYPKKGNKKYDSFVHRDEIFPAMKIDDDGYVPNSDIKFSRMVSMDDVFTVVGLKREKKKEKKSIPASQCVADYENNIEDIEKLLSEHPNELSFYKSLTPGYQKDWARYVFSAKQQKTRDKRTEQMVDILSQGYKSMDLYRQEKK
ncbi:YdeI/OmpD-associated family protein [Evansella sp. AB-P1]|uniref:YdeI/OmpD-associated family protein n=1 Tax=Evansella sp. AB-P1 TaxID=3037653 RepID=UPI0024201B43|nr:YdeI/OmpD-associated family protein [Evansella sp. AB-P1]MDG5788587.1 YdeI/OmpD-associated family protein [Evansella sp. AB-P1]